MPDKQHLFDHGVEYTINLNLSIVHPRQDLIKLIIHIQSTQERNRKYHEKLQHIFHVKRYQNKAEVL